jgi:hypothetical protein
MSLFSVSVDGDLRLVSHDLLDGLGLGHFGVVSPVDVFGDGRPAHQGRRLSGGDDQ